MKKLLFLFAVSVSGHAALAQKSTNGWTSLFDGKSMNGWKKLSGNAEYRIENGAIAGVTSLNTPNTFLVTEKEYGDFILELEVMMEDTTSNSGIQFRSHLNPAGNNGTGRVYGYQYEIDPSSRRWSGGIYDEARRDWLYPLGLNPAAQPAFKNGQFNKVRIECIGHNLRTWVNGIEAAYVVDSLDAKGFIGLQVHGIKKPEQAGKKIFWKNIRIKTSGLIPIPHLKTVYIVNKISNTLTDAEKKDGYKLLFDGVSTKGWKGVGKPGFPEKGWEVKDGVITVQANTGKEGPSGGDIITDKQYTAFDLSFDFNLTVGANSGLKYFVTIKENTPGSALGLEYQVLDDKVHPDAKLGRDGNRTMSSLYDLIPAQKQERFTHGPDQWNTGRVIVYPNNHVEHYLNGIKVLEYDRSSKEFSDLIAISKYKSLPNFGLAKEGYILLQDHGNTVSYRSIRIRELK
jgi:hypothetical protein